MELKPCPHCGGTVLIGAWSCPHCKKPLTAGRAGTGHAMRTALPKYHDCPTCGAAVPDGADCMICELNVEEAARKAPKPVRCPQCGGEQVSAQRKGFGFGKALVGGLTLGVAGIAAGAIGSGKVKVTCLACGHSWTPGK